jgi:hypothetical protein
VARAAGRGKKVKVPKLILICGAAVFGPNGTVGWRVRRYPVRGDRRGEWFLRGATLTPLQHSQDREQVGSSLYFVDHDEAIEPFRGRHRFLEESKGGGILQIED